MITAYTITIQKIQVTGVNPKFGDLIKKSLLVKQMAKQLFK